MSTEVERLRHHLAVLSALREVARTALDEVDPDQLFQRACDLLMQHGGVDSCVVVTRSGVQTRMLAAAGNASKKAMLQSMCANGRLVPCAEAAFRSAAPVVRAVNPDECAGCEVVKGFPGPRDTIATPLSGTGGDEAVMIAALPPGMHGDEAVRSLLADVAGDLSGLARMIHEKSQLRRRQEETESEFQIIFERSPIGKVITAPDGRLLRVNAAFAEMLGHTVQDLRERGFVDITFAEDVSASKEMVRRLLRGEDETASIEKRYLHRGGHVVWTLVNTRLLRDADDLPRYFVTTIQNISHRKRVEQEIVRSEAKYLDLYEHAPDMYVSVDARTGNVLECNETLVRAVGWAKEQIIGRPVLELYHPDSADAARRAFAMFLETGTVDGAELRLQRADGSALDVSLSVTAVRDDNGRIVRSRSSWRDISEKKALERQVVEREEQVRAANVQLLHTNQHLEAANKEIEAFAYSVSHDLRQPLRAIDGFSRLLMDRHAAALEPTAKNYLERVRAGAQRMGALIDDILRLSRITRAEMRIAPVDLTKLARETVEELHVAEPGRSATWEIAEGLVVEADPILMRAVLQNLLGNAWKYTGRREHARIELGAIPGNEPTYFVRDNGAGFDMRYADKLFGAFQRLHGVEEFPGTGVGLATVQRIVHRHGGRIWAEAAVDEGAAFYFTLAPASIE